MVSEEDIKRVKKFIKAFKTDDTKSVCGFDVQTIENLLQGYKELKNENEDLKNLANNKQWISPCYVAQNYIPKSLVEEAKQKIEKARDLASELIEHKA